MLEVESSSIQLSEVDWNDTSCLITYGPLPNKLIHSIQAVGLIQPPLLQRKKSGLLRIVCGSRRLTVCQKVGLDIVPCRVLSNSVAHQACLRLAIHDNVAQRTLNPVEKSLVLTKMAEYLEQPELIKEFMSLLDLEPSVTLFSRYERLSHLEQVILDSLARGGLHERIAFALAPLEQGDRLALFRLFEEFPFSVSVQEEIIETVGEIARRDNLSLAQVLDSKEVRTPREAQERPKRQRAQEIRKKLQARRAPRLTARKERFAREAKELGLPSGVRLVPPPYFEGPKWSLECTFEGADELAARLRTLIQLAGQPRFQRILESK